MIEKFGCSSCNLGHYKINPIAPLTPTPPTTKGRVDYFFLSRKMSHNCEKFCDSNFKIHNFENYPYCTLIPFSPLSPRSEEGKNSIFLTLQKKSNTQLLNIGGKI